MSEDSENQMFAPEPPEPPEPAEPGSHGDPAPDPRQRQLVLVKRGQRYVFRYRQGEEAGFLKDLMEMVGRPESELDWFDAAVLSHQMGQTLGKELQSLHKR